MTKTPLEAGSFIQAYCTRCQAVLRHTIVALVREKPVRVKCNTCGGEHAYKTDAPGQAPVERPARGSSSKAKTAEADWQNHLSAAVNRGAKGRPYSLSEGFKAGEVLDHPSFGVGVVQRALGPGKILVLFKDGSRTLLCRSST